MVVLDRKDNDMNTRLKKTLLIAVLVISVVTVLLPYSPLSPVLGFVHLPLVPVLALGGIAMLYVFGSELAKKVFYYRVQR